MRLQAVWHTHAGGGRLLPRPAEGGLRSRRGVARRSGSSRSEALDFGKDHAVSSKYVYMHIYAHISHTFVCACHLGWHTLLKCNKTNHACLYAHIHIYIYIRTYVHTYVPVLAPGALDFGKYRHVYMCTRSYMRM